jgi:hypothetical protein
MTCRTVRRLFVDFLGEGLPLEYGELIEEHLAACPLCASSADGYRDIIRLARQLPPALPPPHFLEQLRRAARATDVQPPGGPE